MSRSPPDQNHAACSKSFDDGHSWLTDLVTQSGRLGNASEAFNPNFCRIRAEKLGICSLEKYLEVLKRRETHGGVCSFEITAFHLRWIFEDAAQFFYHFRFDPYFWLIREDIVAQAVSLSKMSATKVTHSVSASLEDRAAAERNFTYDANILKKKIKHVHNMEKLTERWIAEWELAPLRMSYEGITRLTPHQMLNVIARHASLPDVPPVDITPRHEKLGTSRNVEFAERFREEEAEWLAPIEAERAARLDKLDDIRSLVPDL